ncbi:NUDIX domain-containing protein [Streptomyces sp. NPDC048111]|uniref:NUDIX hydrolase n=1 Tax=Streptomyces sp. NPDC048111 TaxID=3365500 RepID=UPI00371FEB55
MPYTPPLWPVSVKGVVLDATDRVLLLRNERGEWELPGGRLEIGSPDGTQAPDARPEAAVEREIAEETGWTVTADRILEGGTWIYEPIPGRRVLIVTYGCRNLTPGMEPVISHEHKELALFTAAQVPALNMPDGYKRSIAAWLQLHAPGVVECERM